MFFAVAKSRRDFAARRTWSGDRIVVSTVLLPALLTLKLVPMTVIIVDVSALVASLARVFRIHRIHEHAPLLLFRLVLDKLCQIAERPH
ncbi:MAG: hypothetical protein J07HQW1_00159 [Haloquadratum walsbyi J07HQW1]|uniref:Uncharacterized protein n=1 Tax=Haloquadratum walsbyi J07HQW1 TaxID=1238424 RepID=U1N0Z9_9EURY|nr:MAG: hypothetical protein J07HQW1_00159 [Haloquadratum walsbyi J07HQW1]